MYHPFLRNPHHDDQTCLPRRAMFPYHIKLRRMNTQICVFSSFLLLLLLLLLVMECVWPCRSTCCHTDEAPSFLGRLNIADDYRTPVSGHRNFSSRRMHSAMLPRDFAPPNNPPGRVHTTGGRTASHEKSDKFPLASDYPHICFLLDLLLQLMLMLLLSLRMNRGLDRPLKIAVGRP